MSIYHGFFATKTKVYYVSSDSRVWLVQLPDAYGNSLVATATEALPWGAEPLFDERLSPTARAIEADLEDARDNIDEYWGNTPAPEEEEES